MKKKMIRPEIKVIKMETVSALASSEIPEISHAKSNIQGLSAGSTITMGEWELQ